MTLRSNTHYAEYIKFYTTQFQIHEICNRQKCIDDNLQISRGFNRFYSIKSAYRNRILKPSTFQEIFAKTCAQFIASLGESC